MGSCDRSDIHDDMGSHNSVLMDLNLEVWGCSRGLEGNLETLRRAWVGGVNMKVFFILFYLIKSF